MGMARRKRTTGTAAAKEAEPKSRRSPRAAKGPGRKAKPTGRAAAAAALSEDEESDHGDLGLEELSLSDDAMPETPTRRRGRATPAQSSARKQRATEVIISPISPGRRGRKRKSEMVKPEESLPSPPAKRGRPRKIQAPEPEPQTPAKPRRAAAQKGDESPAEDDIFVDIVSPSKFESSRSKIRSGRQRSAAAARNPASEDADSWRAKYEELLKLRVSQPEKDYKEYQVYANKRYDAADEVIKKLRKEVAGLKRQAEKQPAAAASKDDAEASVRQKIEKEFEKQIALLRQQVETLTQDVLAKDQAIERLEKHRKLTETSTDYNLRQKLRVMEEVTGLAIDDLVAEDDGLSYICRQAGPAAAAKYVLTVFDDLPNDYQYTPFGADDALAALPTYLREPISFERSAANMFHWRLCDHLHNPADSSQPPPANAVNGT
ncbi:hypothetical protein LPJ63_002400 [Coemansia sp. RSA 2711]|nr:hypothetical protein LPJ63_002400 [Coemansia sp. RSA 2711]KAJ2314862.1 hypothetical protein IWW54_000658 [Coemansia sp. RSA 2705]KAJ2368619.1 hypothetical protein H4S01_001488 [Coemansia sp. RSA 2610]